MPLTLGDAKKNASLYVETGLCENDVRVTPAINQAVALIHGMGDFVGMMLRYAIVPDENGEFLIPSGLANITRVSEAIKGTVGSPEGILIASDAYVFVMDTPNVLPVRQVAANRFKILGRRPSVIDVMGKVVLKEAVNNQDVLACDDIYALRLAIAGQHYMLNGRGEMSQTVLAECVSILGRKTETATAEARRISFTAIQGSSAKGTLGYARSYVSLHVEGGLRLADHKIISLINSAEEIALSQTMPWVSGFFRVKNNEFSLPTSMKRLLKVDINNCPTTIQSQWFEYNANGMGYNESNFGDNVCGINATYRGTNALHTNLTRPSRIKAYAYGDDIALDINIQGFKEDGSQFSEILHLSQGQLESTVNTCAQVVSITKPPSSGPVSILIDDPDVAGDIEVAFMDSRDMSSEVARYSIPGNCGVDCDKPGALLRVIAIPAHRPLYRDDEKLFTSNLTALVELCMSIIAKAAGNIELSSYLKNSGLALLEKERINANSGHRTTIEIQGIGWGNSTKMGR